MEANIPIVTLDKIYITPNEEDIYFLDCTRIDGTDKMISRKSKMLDSEIMMISNKINNKEILLADDVVFSGSVLKSIIDKFSKFDIKVIGVITSICTYKSYKYFNLNLKYGIKSNYLMSSNVIDQICERDFYFGIAGSGIMIETKMDFVKLHILNLMVTHVIEHLFQLNMKTIFLRVVYIGVFVYGKKLID